MLLLDLNKQRYCLELQAVIFSKFAYLLFAKNILYVVKMKTLPGSFFASPYTGKKSTVLAISTLVAESLPLSMLHVVVPAYRVRGQSALLECEFSLGTDTLYSVKWYRDNEEFYRYMPKYDPPKHAYKLEGVKVDVSFFVILFWWKFITYRLAFTTERRPPL